jgi:hypothetical protein
LWYALQNNAHFSTALVFQASIALDVMWGKQRWSVHPVLQLLVAFVAFAGLRQLQLASRSSSAAQTKLQDASTGAQRASTAEIGARFVHQQPKNECEDFVSLAAADGHVIDAAALHDGVILSGSITAEDAYNYYQVYI